MGDRKKSLSAVNLSFSFRTPSYAKLVSECLLFVSFFWASFHSLSSLTLGISLGEGFYLPDPFWENFLLSYHFLLLSCILTSFYSKPVSSWKSQILVLSILSSNFLSFFSFKWGLDRNRKLFQARLIR